MKSSFGGVFSNRWSFPGGSDCRNLPAGDLGDLGFIPGSGRSPEKGNGNPVPYSRLENPHGQRSLSGCTLLGHKELDTTEQLTLSFFQAAQGLPCPALIPRLLESHVPGPLGFLYTPPYTWGSFFLLLCSCWPPLSKLLCTSFWIGSLSFLFEWYWYWCLIIYSIICLVNWIFFLLFIHFL